MATTKTTNNHPEARINHLLLVDTRVRKNKRRKACRASINDLATKLRFVDIVSIRGGISHHTAVPTLPACLVPPEG